MTNEVEVRRGLTVNSDTRTRKADAVYDVIADALAEQGQEYLFGVEGGAEAGYVRGYGERLGRFVSTADAGTVVAMADGYSRASGRVAVVILDSISGLAAALVPLLEAVRGRTPLLVLCPSPLPGPANPCLSVSALWMAGAGGGHGRLHDVGSVVRDLNRASQLAVTEERPVVLAGWGAVVSDAGEELVRLADRIGGVLATTVRANGLFRGQSRDIGIFGRCSSDVASAVISEADCVVAFGASLNRFTTLGGALVEGKRIVHVDHDPTQFGLSTPVTEAVRWFLICASHRSGEMGQCLGRGLDLDLRAIDTDQIDLFDRLRRRERVVWSDVHGWMILGHRETLTVLEKHETFSNRVSRHVSVPNGMDPPTHTPGIGC